jgi:hypothetical protein
MLKLVYLRRDFESLHDSALANSQEVGRYKEQNKIPSSLLRAERKRKDLRIRATALHARANHSFKTLLG